MDKYEYRLKAEQIEKLAGKKDYETAARIADTIDWRRVRSLDMLYVVSEVYEAMERYEDCMEILNIAYDRAPVGRMLLYKMTEIATKMHEFKEAINLYREFVKELEAEFPGYQVQRVDELSLSVACHIGDGCLAVACSRVVEV